MFVGRHKSTNTDKKPIKNTDTSMNPTTFKDLETATARSQRQRSRLGVWVVIRHRNAGTQRQRQRQTDRERERERERESSEKMLPRRTSNFLLVLQCGLLFHVFNRSFLSAMNNMTESIGKLFDVHSHPPGVTTGGLMIPSLYCWVPRQPL